MKRGFWLTICRRSSALWRWSFTLAALSAPLTAFAQDDAIKFRAEHYRADLDRQLTIMSGGIEVRVGNQILKADKGTLDSAKGTVTAEGQVRFEQGELVIEGEKVELDMKSGEGSFHGASLRAGTSLYLEGKILRRVGRDRYQAENGKISTCMDCPQPWSVTGVFIDVELEGYAEVHHALFQIRDTPVIYFPIFYFPVKTKRQSGFLVPQFSSHSALGSQFMLPFFWATTPSTDSTFEYRYMTKAGSRLGWELRHRRSDRSFLEGFSSFGRCTAKDGDGNCLSAGLPRDRFGFSFRERWQISRNWTQRFRGEMASDTLYTQHFDREFQDGRLPSLLNEPSITWQNHHSLAYGIVQLQRDNLVRTVEREPGIHTLPELGFDVPATHVWGPLNASVELQHDTFRRFSTLPDPGLLTVPDLSASVDPDSNWIRTGDRTTAQLRLAAPLDVLRHLQYIPAAELRGDLYNFQALNVPSTAARGRFYFENVLRADAWRVFRVDDVGSLKALRHTMSPVLRWSWSPPEALTNARHPFFSKPNAPRFDIFDPDSDAGKVDLGTVAEELRLRPHERVSLGLDTRLVARYGDATRSYEELLSAGIYQDFDLRVGIPDRLQIQASGRYAGISFATELRIATRTVATEDNTDPEDKRVLAGEINTRSEMAYALNRYRVGAIFQKNPTQKVLTLTGGISDIGPWGISGAADYDFQEGRPTGQVVRIDYNSTSRCWGFFVRFTQEPGSDPAKFNFDIQPGFSWSEGKTSFF